jgi:hypothetical protein
MLVPGDLGELGQLLRAAEEVASGDWLPDDVLHALGPSLAQQERCTAVSSYNKNVLQHL